MTAPHSWYLQRPPTGAALTVSPDQAPWRLQPASSASAPRRQQRCHCVISECFTVTVRGCRPPRVPAAREQLRFGSRNLRYWQPQLLGGFPREGVRVRYKISSFRPYVHVVASVTKCKIPQGAEGRGIGCQQVVAALPQAQRRWGHSPTLGTGPPAPACVRRDRADRRIHKRGSNRHSCPQREGSKGSCCGGASLPPRGPRGSAGPPSRCRARGPSLLTRHSRGGPAIRTQTHVVVKQGILCE